MNLTDFIKGVDITGLPAVNASDFNNLVDLATTNNDRGLLIYTVDSALDTPVVPDVGAFGYTFGKRYIWLRLPYVTSGSYTSFIYGWNDNAPVNGFFLKWLPLTPDLTSLSNDVATALANAQTAINAAQTANANATAANVLSQQAATIAGAANTSAQGAAANASAALTALNGQVNVSGAIQSLQAAIAAATGTAGAQKSPANALTPGTIGQQVRTNSAASAAEWFSPEKQIVTMQDTAGGTPTANVAFTRNFSTISDPGGNVISNASGVFVLTAGTWKVTCVTQAHSVDHCSKVVTPTATIWGTATFAPAATQPSTLSMILGIITSDGVSSMSIQSISDNNVANGFGTASGIAGVTNVYGTLILEKIK